MIDKIYEILSEMEQYAVTHNVPIIQKESTQLLCEITAANKPVSILEIGTAIGYSTLLLAAAMPVHGKITTIELDEQRVTMAKRFFSQAGINNEIEFITGNAGEVLSGLTGKFDFVFIDAAKGQYLDYLFKIMDKLSPGAIVIADNVLFRGWVLGSETIPKRFRTIVKRLKAYLDFVSNDVRFDTVIHHIGDGVAVSHYQGEQKHEK
ncbi:MAG: putative O-methyltransferase [Firmicutes bacterium]|nr:putative O-methyltransferase [Bacillota bacterium]